MFEIIRQTMSAEVRCRNCHAALTIDSDHRSTIDRSIAAFERRHTCRDSKQQSRDK